MTPWPARAAIVLFALLSFFQFPGHTWLQQDTQIYTPILEHLRDPGVLAKDILVERPHVSFTLYDEFALLLRRITGLEFRDVLGAQQLVTRALGIWGFYLLAAAAGLEPMAALLVTAILSLGAFIAGPEVLIFEYEPSPRAFAVPLLVLATGLAAHARHLAGGIAGAIAFLIHPPTVYPFWIVYTVIALRRPRRLQAFLPLAAAAVVVFIASRFQTGQTEAQTFFERIDPLLEKLQHMRTAYTWISTWWQRLGPHYLIAYALTLAAYFRLRAQMTPGLRVFHIGMPLVGVLSMPLSWLLLEKLRWVLMPQLQPVRALLFVTLFAIFSAAAAGCAAGARRRYAESFAWFAAAYLLPIDTNLLVAPHWRRIAVVLVLGAAAVMAQMAPRFMPAVALAAFFLIPVAGGVVNYPKLHTKPLEELSRWARSSTPPDAVFVFPNFGKDLSPGIFRSEALRAIYVDWKGGGQVNYLRELGEQWWSRWQQVSQRPLASGEYRALGIDYVVTRAGRDLPGANRVFANSQFSVFRL